MYIESALDIIVMLKYSSYLIHFFQSALMGLKCKVER